MLIYALYFLPLFISLLRNVRSVFATLVILACLVLSFIALPPLWFVIGMVAACGTRTQREYKEERRHAELIEAMQGKPVKARVSWFTGLPVK